MPRPPQFQTSSPRSPPSPQLRTQDSPRTARSPPINPFIPMRNACVLTFLIFSHKIPNPFSPSHLQPSQHPCSRPRSQIGKKPNLPCNHRSSYSSYVRIAARVAPRQPTGGESCQPDLASLSPHPNPVPSIWQAMPGLPPRTTGVICEPVSPCLYTHDADLYRPVSLYPAFFFRPKDRAQGRNSSHYNNLQLL